MSYNGKVGVLWWVGGCLIVGGWVGVFCRWLSAFWWVGFLL